MKLNRKFFPKFIALVAFGVLGTACAPIPTATSLERNAATKQTVSPTRNKLILTSQGAAEPMAGTAFYPTITSDLGPKRATLLPPERSIPDHQIVTASSGVEPEPTGPVFKAQSGSRPVRGYQSGRALSEERDSFDGVDVASATESGSGNSGGGAGGAASSSGSSGGGNSVTTSY